jgi:hypothetical protein
MSCIRRRREVGAHGPHGPTETRRADINWRRLWARSLGSRRLFPTASPSPAPAPWRRGPSDRPGL